LKKGTPTTIEFTVGKVGAFPFEIYQPAARHGRVRVNPAPMSSSCGSGLRQASPGD
jgi:hypothetical protein